MTCRAAFVWQSRQHFSRLIEECGMTCELVTPQMLAAPFYRGVFNCIIIPTGFANPVYTNLLPALRASSSRIERFVRNGGNLLVFGAAADKPDAYDWLPFTVVYRHDCHPRRIVCSPDDSGTIIDDYDPDSIECDGWFPHHDGVKRGTAESADVILEKQVGDGRILVTSIHEFPSRRFLKNFCSSARETTF